MLAGENRIDPIFSLLPSHQAIHQTGHSLTNAHVIYLPPSPSPLLLPTSLPGVYMCVCTWVCIGMSTGL